MDDYQEQENFEFDNFDDLDGMVLGEDESKEGLQLHQFDDMMMNRLQNPDMKSSGEFGEGTQDN
jgi:hypothetical protein